MEASAAYFLETAAQCRRLAFVILNGNDPAVVSLKALAEEFEAQAAAYQAREWAIGKDS